MNALVVSLRPALPIRFDRYQRKIARTSRGTLACLDSYRESINANYAKLRESPDDEFVVDQCIHNICVLKIRYRLALSALHAGPKIEWPDAIDAYREAAE